MSINHKTFAYVHVLNLFQKRGLSRTDRPLTGLLRSVEVTLKSQVSRLFFQGLDPNWAYSLNTEYLNLIQMRSSSLWKLQPMSWFLWVLFKSFPSPPPWTWKLFVSVVEFIHGLKLVQNAMCSDENLFPKHLLKCPILVFAGLPVSHQALFFNTVFNLILEPIQRE